MPRKLLIPLAQAALLAACLLMPSCATVADKASPARNHLPEPVATSALRPGDSLSIALQGVPDAATHAVQVDDAGFITLPYIGAVEASGQTVASLSGRIRQTYIERKIYHQVEINVTATERFVFVGGEVNRPGRVLWTPDLTVTKAIQAAGGYTVYASENRLTVIRDRVAHPFDAQAAQRHPEEDAKLAPGDSIQVPKSAF